MQKDFIEDMLGLANYADKIGHFSLANDIEEAIKDRSLLKVAQYVGAIGYALQFGRRSVANCIRKKRASSNQPMQEIVMECLSEFQEQPFYENKWLGKYASQDVQFYVNKLIKEAARAGIDPSSATTNFIKDLTEQNDLQNDIGKINKLWQRVKESSLDKDEKFGNLAQLAKKVAQLSNWQGMKNLWRKWRGGETRQVEGLLDEIQQNLQYMIQSVAAILPKAKQIGTVLGVQPDQDYDRFYALLQQYMSQNQVQASKNRWKRYYLEKESAQTANAYEPGYTYEPDPYKPRQIPAGKPKGGKFQKKVHPEYIPPAEYDPSIESTTGEKRVTYRPAQIQPEFKGKINQQDALLVYNNIPKVQRSLQTYFNNLNNLFAKLQTFRSITSDETIRGLSQKAFNVFNEMYSKQNPFDITALQNIANVVGNLQNQLSSLPATETTSADETTATEVESPGEESTVQFATEGSNLYQRFVNKLPQMNQKQISDLAIVINYLEKTLGEVDPDLRNIRDHIKSIQQTPAGGQTKAVS